VRITHIPTGLVTGCQNERSQHKNKERAMKMMRSKLYEYELDKKKAISRKLEDSKLDIKFGSQIRSYVLQPYRMAKDLRTRVEVGDVDKVLDGDLEPFIRGYLRMRREGNLPASASGSKALTDVPCSSFIQCCWRRWDWHACGPELASECLLFTRCGWSPGHSKEDSGLIGPAVCPIVPILRVGFEQPEQSIRRPPGRVAHPSRFCGAWVIREANRLLPASELSRAHPHDQTLHP
jgi:hypothetical protein